MYQSVIGVLKFYVAICPKRWCFENILGVKSPTYKVHYPSVKTNLFYFNQYGPLLTAKGEKLKILLLSWIIKNKEMTHIGSSLKI